MSIINLSIKRDTINYVIDHWRSSNKSLAKKLKLKVEEIKGIRVAYEWSQIGKVKFKGE